MPLTMARLVDDLAQRQVVAAPCAVMAATRLAAARVSASRSGVLGATKAAPGRCSAHDFHQHLVAVGGAVEGAGAGGVIALGLGLEQRIAIGLALRIQLAHARLLDIRQARGHRPGRHEDDRQMAEGQRADHQPGHDLVADAQAQRGIEHVVGQRHRGRHRDHVAAEQRQLHAGQALRDAIAHRRHAAGELRHGAGLARRHLDQRRVALQRLVRRQHVVVGRDDADVRPDHAPQFLLVGGLLGGNGVRQVGAGQLRAGGAAALCRGHALQVVAARCGDSFPERAQSLARSRDGAAPDSPCPSGSWAQILHRFNRHVHNTRPRTFTKYASRPIARDTRPGDGLRRVWRDRRRIARDRSSNVLMEPSPLEIGHADGAALTAAVSQRIVGLLQSALSAGRPAQPGGVRRPFTGGTVPAARRRTAGLVARLDHAGGRTLGRSGQRAQQRGPGARESAAGPGVGSAFHRPEE